MHDPLVVDLIDILRRTAWEQHLRAARRWKFVPKYPAPSRPAAAVTLEDQLLSASQEAAVAALAAEAAITNAANLFLVEMGHAPLPEPSPSPGPRWASMDDQLVAPPPAPDPWTTGDVDGVAALMLAEMTGTGDSLALTEDERTINQAAAMLREMGIKEGEA